MKKIVKATATAVAALIAASAFTCAPVFAAGVSATKATVANADKGIKISWKKAKGAKKYLVLRKTTGKYKTIKTVKGSKTLSFTDKTAKAGTKYTYTVKTVNGSSNATASATSIVRLGTVKSVKVSLGKDSDGVASVKLSWKKVKGAKKYEIYYAEKKSSKYGKYKLYGTSKKTTYLEGDDWESEGWTTSGYSYKFKVRAVNGKSKGAFSAATGAFMYLDASEFTAKMDDDHNAVKLSFMPVSGAKGYKIYRSVGKGNKSFKLIKDSSKFTKENPYEGLPIDSEYLKDMYTFTYEDKDIKYDEVYNYYVVAYSGKTTSKSDTATVKAREYDGKIQIGEENADTSFTALYNFYSGLKVGGMSLVSIDIKSSNEKVLRIDITDGENGKKIVKFVGVSEGDAFVTVTVSSMGISSGNMKLRFHVQADPVYEFELKVGETKKASDVTDTGSSLAMDESDLEMFEKALKITYTSTDENVLKVSGSGVNTSFTGVSAGVAELSYTAKLDISAMASSAEEKAMISLMYGNLFDSPLAEGTVKVKVSD